MFLKRRWSSSSVARRSGASAFSACGATRRRSRSRLSAEHMPAARAFERRRVLRQNPFVDSIAGLTTCALDLDHLSPHLLRDPYYANTGQLMRHLLGGRTDLKGAPRVLAKARRRLSGPRCALD